MKLGGCQVIIKCDDRTMREVGTAVTGCGKAVSCYIASQPGKEFFIEYSRNLNYGPPATELVVDVGFDGVQAGPGWIAPDPEPGKKKVIGEIWGARHGDKLHKFAFTKPELIDAETPSSIDPDRMGEILIRLSFAAEPEQMREGTEQLIPGTGPPQVNEKDKKPGVHCANVVVEESPEECTEPMFWSVASEKDFLLFIFKCRADEWLQAEGLIRKRRRQGGEPEPAEDQETKPKPEPLVEVIPTGEVLAGGMSTAESPPRPQTQTPLSSTDEPGVKRGDKAHPISQPKEQEQASTSDSTTLERPRKIPRRSGNSTATNVSKTRPAVTATRSIQRSPAEGAGLGSKVKAEEDGLPDVKMEEGVLPDVKTEEGGLPNVKMEEGGSVPKIKKEVGEIKVSELNGAQARERKLKELEEQISNLKKERDEVLGETDTPRVQTTERKTRVLRPKIKAERESTKLPTPEVIDLAD